MKLESFCRRRVRAGIAGLRRDGALHWLALTIWGLILLIISVRVVLFPQKNNLYPIFEHAGWKWLHCGDLYVFERADPDMYRYSPLIAALFAPLSLCPESLGNVVWRWLNAGVYLTALAWWCRVIFAERFAAGRQPLAWLFLLAVPFSIGSLNNGQSNALVIGLLLAAVAGAATERWNLASICVALACLFKVYPLAVGLLLVVVFPRRLAGRLVLALAGVMALPYLTQHPAYVTEQYAHWFGHLKIDHHDGIERYRDLRLLFRTWLWPLPPSAYQAIQLACAAGIAVLCFLQSGGGRRRRPLDLSERRQVLMRLLALACCWMTLLGPATESCTYILLTPSLAAAILLSRHERHPLRILPWASYVLLLLPQMAVWFPGGVRLQELGPHPCAVLLFLIYLLASPMANTAPSRLCEASLT